MLKYCVLFILIFATLYAKDNLLIENYQKKIDFIQLDLFKFNGVTKRTIERWIKQLKDEDKIKFLGASKTGGYYAK